MALVSVCITTYNHAEYIEQCLDSVLAQQTNFPFEIIIGEDESSDDTREICRTYAANHPGKIRLCLRSRKDVIYVNGKATGRFNFTETMKAAKGKYIALLEGDDYWIDPLKLQKQVDLLEAHPEHVLSYHWQKITEQNENGIFGEKTWPKESNGYMPLQVTGVRELFTFNLRPQTRTLVFRNIFAEHPFPDWYYKVLFGDLALCFILGRHGSFYFFDEEMAVYRVTRKGASSIFREKKGYISGNKAWLQVWTYAIRHHEYKFVQEALSGMNIFLSRIRECTGNSYMQRLALARFILFRLQLVFPVKKKLVTSLLKKEYK